MQPMDERNSQEIPGEDLPAVEPEAEIQALSERLLEAEKARDEYLDMAQRVQAEFDNFRRRNNAVRSEAYDEGAREMVGQFLPVIDNLERAIDAADKKTALREGVELVHKQILEILERRGVEVIDRKGEPFDPNLEDAVMQVDASCGDPGTVAAVLQKGYRMGERVIRHAMVQVVEA